MKSKLLLPHRCKFVGWVLLMMAVILWVLTALAGLELNIFQGTTLAVANGELMEGNRYFTLVEMNLTNTIMGSLFIIGGLLVTFSREKIEDEFIMNLRLTSLKWAVLINYLVLLALFVFVHGYFFLLVMVYNMFTILILYIVRFQYLLIKNRVSNHEE